MQGGHGSGDEQNSTQKKPGYVCFFYEEATQAILSEPPNTKLVWTKIRIEISKMVMSDSPNIQQA